MEEFAQSAQPKDADQRSKSTQTRSSQPEIYHDGDIDYATLRLFHLKPVSIVAQALDNQWVPQPRLYEMIERGRSRTEMAKQLEPIVRKEYLRGLINAEQFVINRGYIYNNPVVSQDYLSEGESREAFKKLLGSGVIVPYLYRERSPIDPPAFGTDPESFAAWQQLCEEVCTQCVRLSWNDTENQKFSRIRLERRFSDFAETARRGDLDQYVRDLGIHPDRVGDFRKRLQEMTQFCSERDFVTRDDLYKEFVTAGDNPAKGKYDRDKPFAAEIKQLLDLAYNAYLPDALGGYELTPNDSLPRTALQELQQAAQHPETDSEELLNLLRRADFSRVQEAAYLKSVGYLSLQDVLEVRGMEEWSKYIESLRELLRHPLNFTRGAAKVRNNYIKLAKRMTALMIQKRTERITEKWTPVIRVVIHIAGAILTTTWLPDGAILYRTMGDVSEAVAEGTAPVVVRLIIGRWAESKFQADLDTSIDFMKRHMWHAEEQWEEIVAKVKEIPRFQKEPVQPEKQEANINYPEQQRPAREKAAV